MIEKELETIVIVGISGIGNMDCWLRDGYKFTDSMKQYKIHYKDRKGHILYLILDKNNLSESQLNAILSEDKDMAKLTLSIIINQKPELIIGSNNLDKIKEILL